MSVPSMKSLVTSTLALSICLAPFKSMADDWDQKPSMANQVATAAGNTLDQVQKQNDAQLAKLMSEYAATTLVIIDMKAANLYNQALSQIDSPTVRQVANATTYTVVLGSMGWQAWKTLERIGKIPSLIKATPGLKSKITSIGGAALRTAVLGGVAYALWNTNAVLLLDKQDYTEILMRLEAQSLTLEKQLNVIAKAKLNPSTPAGAKAPGAPANSELFKLE